MPWLRKSNVNTTFLLRENLDGRTDWQHYQRDKDWDELKNHDFYFDSGAELLVRGICGFQSQYGISTRLAENPLIISPLLNQRCLHASQIRPHNFSLAGKD